MALSDKKSKQPPVKLTAAEVRVEYAKALSELEKLKSGAYCYMCGSFQNRKEFYVSTDPYIKPGLSPICKSCAKKIALRVDKNGDEHESTKESVITALKYLNKPFHYDLWNSSIQEYENLISGNNKTSVWAAYIKNVSMGQYNTETYFHSDFFKEKVIYEDEMEEYTIAKMSNEELGDFEKNKADVVKLIGYDPFELEVISDQPFLYSQLIGLLDTGGDENDDMMRNASCISIVRSFLQISKIDNTIAKLMADINSIDKNSATIKSLQDSRQKIVSTITNLAAESCISLKNNKNAKKGENTWTGKLKKIKDMNLRDGEVNGFDINTCRGMQQVQEISDASIMKQLKLDESEWSDMVAEMRVTLVDLRRKLEAYEEINRIILRENLDLRDTLQENSLLNKKDVVDLRDLYSVFANEDGGDDESE